MILPTLDWVAIVLCLILGVVSGSVWFNPKTFFPLWWQGIGKSEQDQPGAGQNMGVVFGLTFVATLGQALGLACIVGMVYPEGYSVLQAVGIGILVWAGIIAPTSLVNKLFAGHKISSWLIETSNHLLNMCIFGVVLGIFAG